MIVRQYAKVLLQKRLYMRHSSTGRALQRMVHPSPHRDVLQRISFTVFHFTSEEASEEPITTCMTLVGGTRVSLSVRLYFQLVLKVQYISTHHT